MGMICFLQITGSDKFIALCYPWQVEIYALPFKTYVYMFRNHNKAFEGSATHWAEQWCSVCKAAWLNRVFTDLSVVFQSYKINVIRVLWQEGWPEQGSSFDKKGKNFSPGTASNFKVSNKTRIKNLSLKTCGRQKKSVHLQWISRHIFNIQVRQENECTRYIYATKGT